MRIGNHFVRVPSANEKVGSKAGDNSQDGGSLILDKNTASRLKHFQSNPESGIRQIRQPPCPRPPTTQHSLALGAAVGQTSTCRLRCKPPGCLTRAGIACPPTTPLTGSRRPRCQSTVPHRPQRRNSSCLAAIKLLDFARSQQSSMIILNSATITMMLTAAIPLFFPLFMNTIDLLSTIML